MNIIERIGTPAVFEQLAEECAELAQASLKIARYLRKENPPAKEYEELAKNLSEEYTDVSLCAECLDLYPDEELKEIKYTRWHMRLDEAQYGGIDDE